MKVAIAPPKVGFQGGIERYSFDLAVALRARGHSVALVDGKERARDAEAFMQGFDEVIPFAELGQHAGIDIVYAQKCLTPATLPRAPGARLLLAAHDHDHTCARSHRYLPIGSAPCHRAPGAACVAFGCAITFPRDAAGKRNIALVNPMTLRSNLAALGAEATFLACSHYIQDRLVDAGVARDRVDVVHPIPPGSSRPAVDRPRDLRLLFVGQLLRGKGVEHAIDALSLLPDATLTVVGDGPSRASLEERARKVAPGRVSFVGYLAPHDVELAYDAASIVVVPSHWPEPFGMVGVEAMRRSRPVVAAAHGGIPEWFGEDCGGRLFTPCSPGSLASSVLVVHEDRDAGIRARSFVDARFSHERFVSSIEALFTRLIAS